MIQLTEEMRERINTARADGIPCILATASPTGEPSVSFRGSMMAWDDDHLAYWDRSNRLGLEHISANPNVVMMYRDPKSGPPSIAWKFFGQAEPVSDSALRDQIRERVVEPEQKVDPEKKGTAVLIRLDRIMSLGGQVVQER